MKALTVRQPFAECIRVAAKPVENRGWRPAGVDPGDDLAIHAGLTVDEDWYLGSLDAAITAALGNRPVEVLERGYVVAVVRLTGYHGAASGRPCCEPWGMWRQWHWEFANVRPLPQPVAVRGQQGLWDLPDLAEARVREQLEVLA